MDAPRSDAVIPAAPLPPDVGPRRSVLPASPPRWDLDFEALARDLRPLGSATRVRLLNFLTVPRYLEEIASFLKINRFAAKKHMDQLVGVGLATREPTQRPQGLVVEYRVAPAKLFELFDAMRALGTLRPVESEDGPARTGRTKPLAAPRGPAGREGGSARLVVVYGVELGKALPLAPGAEPQLVGRDPECAVRILSDPFVSGRHARVERRPGSVAVTDLFSTNGTFVEWERIPPGQTRTVENGHVIGVGKTLLLLRT